MATHRGRHAQLGRDDGLRVGCAFDTSAYDTDAKACGLAEHGEKDLRAELVAELRDGGVKFKVAKRFIGANGKLWRAVKTVVSESAVAGPASRAAGN